VKAVAVHPGVPGSIHLREVPEPRLDEIPDGRGVLGEMIDRLTHPDGAIKDLRGGG
jgi:hypothetical protein